MFNKILVALDQSEMSQQVLQTAIAIAKPLNARLMLMHVLSPVETVYPSPMFAIHSAYPMFREDDLQFHTQQWRDSQTRGLEFLQIQAEVATRAGVSAEYTQGLGDPGRAICALAQSWNAQLIVLGRRGYRGLSELLLGSVSNYVMHHAPCSVLTVQGAVEHLSEPDVAQTSVSQGAVS